MIVIGAGYGRTGTMSLKVALEKLLNGKCYHMMEVFLHPEHMKFWEKTMRNNGGAKGVSDDEWKELLGDYVACCDLPVSSFYKDLARIYPDAKIILTTRDPASWYRSCFNTIAQVMGAQRTFPMNIMQWLRGMSNFGTVMNDITLQDFEYVDWKDEELMKRQFIARNERVKATIPADRLLVFEAKEGWAPLCKFLNVPVPSEPYPRVNDTNEFNSRVEKMKKMGYILVLGVPLLLATGFGYYAYSRGKWIPHIPNILFSGKQTI